MEKWGDLILDSNERQRKSGVISKNQGKFGGTLGRKYGPAEKREKRSGKT